MTKYLATELYTHACTIVHNICYSHNMYHACTEGRYNIT